MFARLPIFIAAIAISCTVAWADPPQLTLHVPFNGDVASEVRGEHVPKVQGKPQYQPGVSGEAVIVGGATRILYDTHNVFNPRQGTLMLWASPLDWDATTQHFQFIATVTSSHEKHTDLLLYKVFDKPNLTFLARSLGQQQRLLNQSILTWQPNQWHHLAITWDTDQFRLYIDGELAADGPAIDLPDDKWAYLTLGATYPTWAYVGAERTAIDELRVYDGALDAGAIQSTYAQQRAQNAKLSEQAEQAQERLHRMKQDNIALAGAGASVITSSFADYNTYYSDQLIDGSYDTAWRSFNDELPQWIELRWEYPIRIDSLAFNAVAPTRIGRCAVYAWDRLGDWELIARVDRDDANAGGRTEISFSRIETDRLRLVIETNDADTVALSEVEAYGPPQTRIGALRPFWHGYHIWSPEPDEKIKMEPRHFRTTFDMDADEKISSAFIQLYTNDVYEVMINDVKVAEGFKMLAPVNITEHLRAGANAVAITCTPTSQPGWPNMALTADITLNSDRGTRFAATDQSWRVAHRPDGEGSPPLMIDRVGEGIWGRLGYVDRTAQQRVVVERVELPTEPAKPGQVIHVRLHLRPRAALHGDHILTFEASEKSLLAGWGDYVFSRGSIAPDVATSRWPTNETTVLDVPVHLPAWSPHGTWPLRLEGLNMTGGSGLMFVGADGQTLDAVAMIDIDRFGHDMAYAASGESHVAQPALVIGGERTVPLLHAYNNPTLEKLHLSSQTGVHLYMVRAYPLQVDGTPQRVDRMVKLLDQHIRAVLSIDPQARILVFYDARPAADWRKANPDTALLTAQGRHGPHSYFSQKHFDMVSQGIRAVTHALERMPYEPNIFAYHVISCGTPDSVLGGVEDNLFELDRSKITVGDYNPEAIVAFQDYLREQYDGDVARLRAAWRNDEITFDTARPINDILTAEPQSGGVFHDPAAFGVGIMRRDYFAFLSRGIEQFLLRLGAAVNEELGGRKILGNYFGYDVAHLRGYNVPATVMQNNNFHVWDMYDSDTFDYNAIVPSYGHRLAGTHYEPHHAVASMRLHDKLFLAELDIRTHTAVTTQHGRQRSVTESVEMLKRDLSFVFMEGQAAWFADWSIPGVRGVGYFYDPAVRDVIAKTRDIYEQTLDVDRTSKAEIAVIISGKAWFDHDVYYPPPIYNNLIALTMWEQLSHIGAPYDVYRLHDLGDDFVQDHYKLYVFINPFTLDDKDRAAVASLKGRDKTLLWFYAPGYVDPNAGLATSGIERATGMRVGMKEGKELMRYAIADVDHAVLEGIGRGTTYKFHPYGYEISNKLHPPMLGPVFYIDDPDARTLATYPDGRAAMAIKDDSIYCAVPSMDRELLRNIARAAGVHLYTGAGPVVKAAGPFVMVHKGYDRQTVALRLPRDATAIDLYTGQTMRSENATIDLTDPRVRTWLLRISE
jgi:hypothetical protein